MPLPIDTDASEAIAKVLAFKSRNPSEALSTAARIFSANKATIRKKAWRAQQKEKQPPQPPKLRGGQNRILSEIEITAIKKYI